MFEGESFTGLIVDVPADAERLMRIYEPEIFDGKKPLYRAYLHYIHLPVLLTDQVNLASSGLVMATTTVRVEVAGVSAYELIELDARNLSRDRVFRDRTLRIHLNGQRFRDFLHRPVACIDPAHFQLRPVLIEVLPR